MKKILHTIFILPWRALGWLRGAIANLLMLLVLLAIVIGIRDDGGNASLPDKAVLYVEPGTAIVEQRSYTDPFRSMFETRGEQPQESVLHEMTSAIRWAKNDAHITALVIRPDWLGGSDLGKLESVSSAIREFKTSGKPVIAIGDNYSQAQYYLASMADKIYINPFGSVQVFGFGAYQTYMKDMLDKLEITMHIFRAGQFKSFVEPFIRNDMSPEARENLSQWMDEQWAFYSKAIEERRKLNAGALDHFINEHDKLLAEKGGNEAQLALDYGLVDQLATRTETEKVVNKLASGDADTAAETVDITTYYKHVYSRQKASELLEKTPRIAIIHASGEISDGYQPPGNTGSETLAELIRSTREDENVAAIVLRIDSPGGSAFASELIRSELAAAQANGKPVIASMGGVAASGGYWIAASADEIWAAPTTITGSIGVFGVVPTLENTLGKLGVHSDGYSTTALADAMQLDRPMNPLAARVLQQGVDFTYGQFLKLVSKGRKSTPEAIDQIAQGRVWTGAHAHRLGLVDHLGELDDAIGAAARLAKIEKYEPDYIEPELGPWETLLQDFSASSLLPPSTQHLLTKLATTLARLPALRAISELQLFNDPNHLYVRCWECRSPIR